MVEWQFLADVINKHHRERPEPFQVRCLVHASTDSIRAQDFTATACDPATSEEKAKLLSFCHLRLWEIFRVPLRWCPWASRDDQLSHGLSISVQRDDLQRLMSTVVQGPGDPNDFEIRFYYYHLCDSELVDPNEVNAPFEAVSSVMWHSLIQGPNGACRFVESVETLSRQGEDGALNLSRMADTWDVQRTVWDTFRAAYPNVGDDYPADMGYLQIWWDGLQSQSNHLLGFVTDDVFDEASNASSNGDSDTVSDGTSLESDAEISGAED